MTGKDEKMRLFGRDLSTITQNVILGSITGIAVGYNLRLLFLRYGSFEIVWVLFFLLGPALGYLSGRERQRLERLKREKNGLEKDISQIRSAFAFPLKNIKYWWNRPQMPSF